MRDGPNLTRRKALKRSLGRLKDDDLLSLENLAALWGTSKARFVTVRNRMETFPNPIPGQGNSYVYMAKLAVQAMYDYETRADREVQARLARTNTILGRTERTVHADPLHTPNELVALNRLAAEIEAREREQGIYVPVAENARVAGEVFSMISEFMAQLPNQVDPHGLLDPDIRTRIKSGADEALLRFHRSMRDMLTADAQPRTTGAAPRGARKARSRRESE